MNLVNIPKNFDVEPQTKIKRVHFNRQLSNKQTNKTKKDLAEISYGGQVVLKWREAKILFLDNMCLGEGTEQ